MADRCEIEVGVDESCPWCAAYSVGYREGRLKALRGLAAEIRDEAGEGVLVINAEGMEARAYRIEKGAEE